MDVQNQDRPADATVSPWLNIREAAARARTGQKRIYRSIAAKQLKAVRLGSRLLTRAEWIDEFLERTATMKEL